jgi:hypothetical protein
MDTRISRDTSNSKNALNSRKASNSRTASNSMFETNSRHANSIIGYTRNISTSRDQQQETIRKLKDASHSKKACHCLVQATAVHKQQQ